jgi:K+-transporting ATPase KdpF subunit
MTGGPENKSDRHSAVWQGATAIMPSFLRNLYTITAGLVSILKSACLTFTLSQSTEKCNGLHLSRRHGGVCRPRRRPCLGLRTVGGSTLMSWLTLAAAIAAAGLLIYLVAALLYPEDFS